MNIKNGKATMTPEEFTDLKEKNMILENSTDGLLFMYRGYCNKVIILAKLK